MPNPPELCVVQEERRDTTLEIARLRQELEESFDARIRLEDTLNVLRRENGDMAMLLDNLTGGDRTGTSVDPTVDELTGVANRFALDRFLAREWKRCTRQGLPVSVVLIDIDDFGRYNERHGSAAGDACLRFVSAAVESCCPRASLTGRYDAEQFGVVLPGEQLSTAYSLGHAMRSTVEAGAFSSTNSMPGERLTVSIGVACTNPRQGDARWAALFEDAAEWLRVAKQRGKNLVCARCTVCQENL